MKKSDRYGSSPAEFACVVIFGVAFLLMFIVWAVRAEPLLIRSLYWTHYDAVCAEGRPPADVATALDSLWPADGYVMGCGQYDWFEPVVAALRKQGKLIVRYLRPTTLQAGQEQDGRASFDRQLHDAFVAKGYVLKDEHGTPLHYNWYSGPFILRWDLISEKEIDDLVSRLAYAVGDLWELDEFFHSLRPWMLELRDEFDQTRLDHLYDKATYQARRDYFLTALVANVGGTQQGRVLFLNGDSLYWYDRGHLVFFENAPAHEFEEMLPKWRARPGCIIEVRTPSILSSVRTQITVWSRINRTITAWLEDGAEFDSWLWADNEAGLYEAEPGRPATWFALAMQAQWRERR